MWQPIETAPRDGRWFLTYSVGSDDEFYPNFDFAKFNTETGEFAKCGCGYVFATHWADIPAPPIDRAAPDMAGHIFEIQDTGGDLAPPLGMMPVRHVSRAELAEMYPPAAPEQT